MNNHKNNHNNNHNNIDDIFKHIVKEKNHIEKLTKKTLPYQVNSNPTKTYRVQNLTNTNKMVHNSIHNRINIPKILNITDDEFKSLSSEKRTELMELLQNYIKIDKSYLMKHEELKNLYTEFSNLYNKKMKSNVSNVSNVSKDEENKHKEMLRTIHNEMKNNNTNLYRSRIMILKKIKEEPHIEPVIKNKLCGGLLAIFKSPPQSDYKQYPMLKNTEEKITIKELDNAYLQKHNELMTVYKAYQNLFNKVLKYKDQLDKYKQLPTGSLISRDHMNKLMDDQGFVMNMIDKMQDELVSKNIISNTEKVPINPVVSNPENIETFNDTMREQIKHIIDRQVEVKPNMKTKIENLLTKYKDCESNDQFCHAKRKLLLIKKI